MSGNGRFCLDPITLYEQPLSVVNRVCLYTPDTESREPEVVSHSVWRVSMQRIPHEKRMVHSLIQPMVKIMRMSGNIAKRKRDEEELSEEECWQLVNFDKIHHFEGFYY